MKHKENQSVQSQQDETLEFETEDLDLDLDTPDTEPSTSETECTAIDKETSNVETNYSQPETSPQAPKISTSDIKSPSRADRKSQVSTTNSQSSSPSQALQPKDSKVLVVLMDREIPGILTYMRNSGLNVSSVNYDPEQVKILLLAQYGKCDVLIIDSGTGRFSGTVAREQILEIISQCENSLSAFIFYTDSAIKADISDTLGRSKKQVTWIPYKSTSVTVANMLIHCNNYTPDEYEYQTDLEQSPDLGYVALQSDKELSTNQAITGFDKQSIASKVLDTEDGLLAGYTPQYKIKLKL